jgi:hypothetical protein
MNPISSHVLFNQISNFKPYYILDLRTSAEFHCGSVKGSFSLDFRNEFAETAIESELLSRKGCFQVVLVTTAAVPRDFVEAISSAISSLKATRPELDQRLLGVFELDYTDFFSKYKNCDGVIVTPECKKKGYNVYFATEIVPNKIYIGSICGILVLMFFIMYALRSGDYENATNEAQLRALSISHIVDASGNVGAVFIDDLS